MSCVGYRRRIWPGQIGVGPKGAPGDPIKLSKNQFLSSVKDTIVPGELVFGYVGDLKISQKSCFYQDPVPDQLDPKWGSKITGKLRTQFIQQLKEQPK